MPAKTPWFRMCVDDKSLLDALVPRHLSNLRRDNSLQVLIVEYGLRKLKRFKDTDYNDYNGINARWLVSWNLGKTVGKLTPYIDRHSSR